MRIGMKMSFRMNLLRDFFEEQSIESRKKGLRAEEERREKEKRNAEENEEEEKEVTEEKEEEDEVKEKEEVNSSPVKGHTRSQSSVNSKKEDDSLPSTSSEP